MRRSKRVTKPGKRAEPKAPPAAVRLDARKRTLESDIGLPGLKQTGGYLYQEFVVAIQDSRRAMAAWREMRENSSLVGGILLVMKNVLRAAERRTEPFSDKPEDRKRAEFVDQCLEDLDRSFSELQTEIDTRLEFGYAPLEVTYKKRQGYQKPTVVDKLGKKYQLANMASSRFNDGEIGWASIALRGQETVNRWGFDDGPGGSMRVLSMFQIPAPTFQEYEIPIDRLLLFRTTAELGNPEGRSLLRSAYFDWIFVKKLTEISGIGAERDLAGLPVLKAPAANFLSTATSDQTAVLRQLKKIGENLRADEQGCVLLPQAWDPETKNPLYGMELLASPGTKQYDIKALIERHEQRMAMSMASDFILLGHKAVGSFALSTSKTDIYSLVLDAFLDAEDDVWNRQAIPRLALRNGWPMDRLPYRKHGKVADTDVEMLAKVLTAYTGAGGVLDQKLDEYLRETFNWPEAEIETGVDANPKPPPQLDAEGNPVEPEPGAPKPAEPEREEDEAPDPQSADQGDEEAEGDQLGKAAHQPRARRGAYARSTGDVFTALKLLQDRQRVGAGDSIAHGFKVAKKPPFSLSSDYKAEIEAAPVEVVPLAGLKATQTSVRRDRVRSFLENPRVVMPGQRSLSGVLEDVPVVVKAGSEAFIFDGHHRLTARRLLGRADSEARVVRLKVEGVAKYSDDQPRDDEGQFADGGGAGGGGASSGGGESGGSGYEGAHFKEPTVSAGGKEAFRAYQDFGYVPINESLRTGSKAKPSVKKAIGEMDKAFKEAPGLGAETTVYRGMSAKHFESAKVGGTITDKGFPSTTTDRAIARQFAKRTAGAVVEIKLPKGAKAIRIGKLTGKNMHNENEVLLRRGTKFKVLSKSPGRIVLEAAA